MCQHCVTGNPRTLDDELQRALRARLSIVEEEQDDAQLWDMLALDDAEISAAVRVELACRQQLKVAGMSERVLGGMLDNEDDDERFQTAVRAQLAYYARRRSHDEGSASV